MVCGGPEASEGRWGVAVLLMGDGVRCAVQGEMLLLLLLLLLSEMRPCSLCCCRRVVTLAV